MKSTLVLVLFVFSSIFPIDAQDNFNSFIVKIDLFAVDDTKFTNPIILEPFLFETSSTNKYLNSFKIIKKNCIGETIFSKDSMNSTFNYNNIGIKIKSIKLNRSDVQINSNFEIYNFKNNNIDNLEIEKLLVFHFDSCYNVFFNIPPNHILSINLSPYKFKIESKKVESIKEHPEWTNFIVKKHNIDDNKTKHITSDSFIAYCNKSSINNDSTIISGSVILLINEKNSYLIVNSPKITIENTKFMLIAKDAIVKRYNYDNCLTPTRKWEDNNIKLKINLNRKADVIISPKM